MYEYKAEYVRVIDGDTVVFDIDLGFGIWMRNESVRFAYLNAPETRTRDLTEKAAGLEAKKFVQDKIDAVIADGGHITLRTYKYAGKFGRFIATVKLHFTDGTCENLNDLLIETGNAVYSKY